MNLEVIYTYVQSQIFLLDLFSFSSIIANCYRRLQTIALCVILYRHLCTHNTQTNLQTNQINYKNRIHNALQLQPIPRSTSPPPPAAPPPPKNLPPNTHPPNNPPTAPPHRPHHPPLPPPPPAPNAPQQPNPPPRTPNNTSVPKRAYTPPPLPRPVLTTPFRNGYRKAVGNDVVDAR